MATTKKKPASRRLCITDLDDGSKFCTTLAAFARANRDDSALVRRARALRAGGSFVTGGGAAPTMRVSAPKRH